VCDGERQRERERGFHSPPTAQVDDDFDLIAGTLEKVTHGKVNDMQAEMVTSVDERRTTLELVDKVAKVVGFIWVVYAFYASLRYNATAVRLHDQLILSFVLDGAGHCRSRVGRPWHSHDGTEETSVYSLVGMLYRERLH
jgi:hypothetical protein